MRAGRTSYENFVAQAPVLPIRSAIADEHALLAINYTSGTTGRPKGVYRPPSGALHQPGLAALMARFGYDARRDVHLCTGPLHHAAPLVFSLAMPLAQGVPVVLMDRWDAEHALRLVSSYRITHAHMVPVMFRRLLELPEDERARYDTSSLRVVAHGAAPCPPDVKQRMIDWLGPVLFEYYAATEGWGCYVDSEEWLARPGTVGRTGVDEVEIRDDDRRGKTRHNRPASSCLALK